MIHLCTFGNIPQYNAALNRIKTQAYTSGYFDAVHIYSQENTPLLNEHTNFITQSRRGYGYWMWKPFVVLDMMEKVAEGDIIVYADAGCSIYTTPMAKHTFKFYIDLVRKSPYKRVGFLNGCKESDWNKGDLIDLLGMRDSTHMDSSQIMAGIHLWVNTSENRKLMEEWRNIMSSNNYHYITDSPSISPNYSGFREHRHDQSVFSLLCKKYGMTTLADPGGRDNTPISITRFRSR
jgi:hypothetical protein